MGERKVLNKYYPPDFDPSKIPKVKRPKNDQVKVRKKFNSRKETVIGDEYLGIKIFRFYIKCTRCSAELTIKTDPKNSDYQCEWGASRNFEPWRENKKVVEEIKGKREKEEMGDAMKALENRTFDNKVEMDILDALDEIKQLNARQSRVDPIEILLQKQKEEEDLQQQLNEEDEALVREMYGERDEDGVYVKRIAEAEGDDDGYGSDFETEAAMRSLLMDKVDGFETFNAAPKKVKTDPAAESESKVDTTPKTIIKVAAKPKESTAKVAIKVTPKVTVKSANGGPVITPKSTNGRPVIIPKTTPPTVTATAPPTPANLPAAKPPAQGLSSLLSYSGDSD